MEFPTIFMGWISHFIFFRGAEASRRGTDDLDMLKQAFIIWLNSKWSVNIVISNDRLQKYNLRGQNMLNQQVLNSKAQRAPKALCHVLQHINQEDYESLIVWMFEYAEYLGLSCYTKFLARTFFDTSILTYKDKPYDQYIPLALTSLALAIKHNEKEQLSEKLMLQVLLKGVDFYLPKSDFFVLETKVKNSLSLVFNYMSPNDYLDAFMERKLIPKLIELALMIPNACQFSAEELFFGAVVSAIDLLKIELNQLQINLLLSLTDCWERAREVANMIAVAILIAQTDQVS